MKRRLTSSSLAPVPHPPAPGGCETMVGPRGIPALGGAGAADLLAATRAAMAGMRGLDPRLLSLQQARDEQRAGPGRR